MSHSNRFHLFLLLALLCGLMLITCSHNGDYILPTPPELQFPNDQLLLTFNRKDWTISSMPLQVPVSTARAKVLWHTLPESWSVEAVQDGWTQKPATPPARLPMINTFRLIYRPLSGQASWAGIITRLAYPVHPDSVKGIEIRVLGNHGVMHVDMGHIDDDITGDGEYYDEDKDHNGVVDESEDVGLEGLADQDEPGYDPVTNPDPNGDNYFFMGYGKCPVPPDSCDLVAQAQQNPMSPFYYEWLNGTEGNRYDFGSLAEPDKEWPGQGIETRNDYFSVSVDLADDTYVVPGSENSFGWKTIRIPADSVAIDTIVGRSRTRSDCWRDINRIRLWFESDGSSDLSDTLEIAAMYFLQNAGAVDTMGAIVVHEYIRDYEYQSGRVFDLGYAGELGKYDTVVNLRMFETGGDARLAGDTVDCLLQIYPDSVDTGVIPWDDPYAAQSDSAAMTEFTDFEYYGYNYLNRGPNVVLRHARSAGEMIGCWMVVRRYSVDGTTFLRQDTIGDLSNEALYVLKSLRGNDSTYSPAHKTWDLMWRNVYAIRPGYTSDDLNFEIYKGLAGTEGNPANLSYQVSGMVNEGSYLKILGLDQYNRQNQRLPDGVLDDRRDVLWADLGLIIFPDSRPFDSDTVFHYADGTSSVPLTLKVPQVYDGSTPAEQVQASSYYLSFVWTSFIPIIRLGRTNIQAKSERVSVNGLPLVRGVDYNIDYRNGILILLGPEADYVSAMVRVTYVTHPNFL